MKSLPQPSRRSPWRLLAAGLAAWALLGAGLRAQTAVTSITTTFTSGSHTTQTILGVSTTIDNDQLAVNTMVDSSGNSYTVTGSAQFAYIRTANAQGTGSGTDPADISAWYMGNNATSTTSHPTSLLGVYDTGAPGTLLVGNNLLAGSDNLFNNINSTSTNNADDVERLDLIYSATGLAATNTLSIGVFDRGTGDTFQVAIITGVDTNGNPTSYGGSLIKVTASDFGTNLLTTSSVGSASSTVLNNGSNLPTEYLLRYDSTTSLVASNVTFDTTHQNQNIAGTVLTLSDFGIATGTRIYGYSLFAGDVTDGGNINNLVNYNNTTYFPASTNDVSGSGDNGGLDPAAVNGVIFTEHPLPEPSTYGFIFVGAALLGALAHRRRHYAALVGNTA